MNKSQRFMNLEGLRGVAAIVVVAYHITTLFYPGIAYGHDPVSAPIQHMRFEDNLYGSPLNVFLSGGFAVGIFFVLSGFVLSIGFFQTGKEAIIKKLASKRYLRLMLPALASVILSFVLLSLHFTANRDAAVAVTHSGLPGEWSFAPNFIDVLRQGTFGIFFNSETYYNPVLWTMMYEFIGSFVVFVFLFLFGKSNYRWLVYAALAMATFGTWYLGFIIGTVIADLYARKKLPFYGGSRVFAAGLLIVGLLIGGYPFGVADGTVYNLIHLSWMTNSANTAVYISIGAALVTVGLLSLSRLSNFFASSRVSRLGKYTYSLYLTHYLIVLTLTTSLFVLFNRSMGYNKSAVFAGICTVPVIIAVTWLFERYVDAPAIKFANYFSDIHHKNRQVKLAALFKQYALNVKPEPMPEAEEVMK